MGTGTLWAYSVAALPEAPVLVQGAAFCRCSAETSLGYIVCEIYVIDASDMCETFLFLQYARKKTV
jgi:hypothetical protein